MNQSSALPPSTTDHAEEERHFRNRLMRLVEQGYTTILIHPQVHNQRLTEKPLFLYLTESGELYDATEMNRQVLLERMAQIAVEFQRQQEE